jgi:hypothetical protein
LTMRVLFLPHNLRHSYYHGLFSEASKKPDWDIAITGPENQRKAWTNGVCSSDNYFVLPDFSKTMDWEADQVKFARLSAEIAKSEIRANIPLNRVVLAGEREIGRNFGRDFYYWPQSKLMKCALSDNSQPATIATRMFAFLDDVVGRFQPDIIISGIIGSPLDLTASLVASSHQIPFAMNRPSKILDGKCFWTMDRGMYNVQARESYDRLIAERKDASAGALERVQKFREQPKTIEYILKNWSRGNKIGWLKSHKNFADRFLAHVAHFVKRRTGAPPKPVLSAVLEYYRGEYLNRRQSHLYSVFSDEDLAIIKYIYLPLHKEPEIALNYQAIDWHNQKNTIAQLSAHLPHGYRLLVREHRFNVGRRPTNYLISIKRYPGVTLVHPLDPQFKYISNADLVVTENGSSGWEGILLGSPVIALSKNFYDPTGISHKLSDSSKLGESILSVLRNEQQPIDSAYLRKLALLYDAEAEAVIADDGSDNQRSLDIISGFACIAPSSSDRGSDTRTSGKTQ